MSFLNKQTLDGKSGEDFVFHFLKRNLNKNWEIYPQPHLNGLKPDFVCLNPRFGILIIEVKNWDLNKYEVEQSGRIKIARSNQKFSVPSPFTQIQKYKEGIYNIYCPRLGDNFKDYNKPLSVIYCGIIFPFEEEDKIKDFLFKIGSAHPQYKYLKYCGKESLKTNNITSILPDLGLEKSHYMNANLADDLRSWLIEPDYSAEQKEDIELNATQKLLINSRTKTGFRRIRGAAGTGKSFVVAGRATELIKEQKDVLVITYNVTLINYLRDICSRFSRGSKNKITWKNFHQWAKDLCYDLNIERKYKKIWREHYKDQYYIFDHDEVLTFKIPALLNQELNEGTLIYTKLYDAILVDEGQDFESQWWLLLKKILKPGGEMSLMVDTTQNIYERESTKWTDDPSKGSGFIGRWFDLNISYRLPPSIIPFMRRFIETFLKSEEYLTPLPDKKQKEFDIFYPCDLKWIQTNKNNISSLCSNEMISIIKEDTERNRSFTDLTFITDNENTGIEVVNKLKKKNIKTIHTYKLKDEPAHFHRKRKMSFYKGDAQVKATTIHSFKGWEGRFIIVHISKAKTKNDFSLIYTALTRVKKHKKGSFITIICSENKLAEYGKLWKK